MLSALHTLDAESLGDALAPKSWSTFLTEQRASAVERQRAHGLPEVWLEQIPEFLESVPLNTEPDRALLHTEVMREHLLVDPATWALTGLFDFEPAMLGDRAYEFAAVGVYTSHGDRRFLGRLMAAYGHYFSPREILAQTLIHVESNLPRYFKVLPAPTEDTLDSLAETWFGTS